MTEMELRNLVVDTANSYLGAKEADGTHRPIIDIYNAHKPLARGYKMSYTDDWCACYVSVIAILCGITSICPKEVGCNQMIKLFQELGSWVEDDAYVPKPGDVIFFDWEDNGVGDNVGGANHVGFVTDCYGNGITTTEGNYGDAVKHRYLTVNAKYIRGYGVPDYGKLATKPAEPPVPEEPEEEDETGCGCTALEAKVAVMEKRIADLEKQHTVYNTLLDVPKWAQKDLTTLINDGVLFGTGDGALDINMTQIRALVWMQRIREADKGAG